MVEPNWELIGMRVRLDTVQAELREIKFGMDVERRDRQSSYSNLVTELGVALGTFETKIETQLAGIAGDVAEVKAIVMGLKKDG
jgi:hypothetical protein